MTNNLAHGPETKNTGKVKSKTEQLRKNGPRKRPWRHAVREEEVKLRGIGFVKQVGFKPGVIERWSYRCTKW